MNARTETTPALDRALSLIDAGFWTFPSWAKDRHVTGWPQRATNNKDTAAQWFSPGGPYADCWPSIYTGKYGDGSQSLLVVDVDPRGQPALDSGILDAILPTTRVHKTPRGGVHGFYVMPFPGVKQGVNVLADGIDVRSKGGLVHFGEGYTLEQDEPLAVAPDALIEKCGNVAPVTAPADRAQDCIAPDQEAAMQQAETIMRAWPDVDEGGRNEAVRDFTYRIRETCGTDAESTLDLGLAFAAERCLPPYPEDEARATIASAMKSAQNPAGSKMPVPASMFTAQPDVAAEHGIIRVHRVCDLAELNPGPALWEGILPERAIFAIGALPGRSKSYVATGLCYAIGTDAGAYLGHALPKGTAAAYVDVERMGATKLRLAVWLRVDGKPAAKLQVALLEGVRLNAPDTVEALIDVLHAMRTERDGRPLSLVVIDSLGAALPGEELNSSKPATMVGAQLRRIRDSLGCAVGIVAHSPKSGDETVAGSLHFDAIFDTTLFVRSEDGAAGSLYVKKDNAMALEEAERFIHWKAATLHAQIGERKARVHRLTGSGAPAIARPSKLKPGSVPDRGFAVLCEIAPDNRPVTLKEWEDAIVARNAVVMKAGVMYEIERRLTKPGLIVKDKQGRFTRKMA